MITPEIITPHLWETEPSSLCWTDSSGLHCIIQRMQQLLALSGYILVPQSHPWYGKSEKEIHAPVHGEITYAQSANQPPFRFSHETKLFVGDDKYWMIGFDCMQPGDFTPRLDVVPAFIREQLNLQEGGVYRDIHYVESKVRELCRAAAEVWR